MATYNISAGQLKAGGILNSFEIPAVGSFTNLYSLDFDGVDDYVDLGNPTELQFTTSFSISLWFKSSDTSDYILISKDKTNGCKEGFNVGGFYC